ncbi:MAG: class I SAM-dependent methyltransferase [Sediminibacterium sp.]|nr:class I SAM-dependent methyltransferase [Chitinophagaceae bacterium]MCA6446803.1 class I SAM-dependent methyltransferase [Chitinophagaceae bacterium]
MHTNLKATRKFNWVSSIEACNQDKLNELQFKMNLFYTKNDHRELYDKMILTTDFGIDPGPITYGFLNWMKSINVNKVLEVGCGQGRIRHHLNGINKPIDYTGIEVSDDVIRENSIKWPKDKWISSGAYDLPFKDESFDICFSFYVIEHLVFPERAIVEMMRVVKKGGYLALIFPDFTSEKRFPSQILGLSELRSAKEKIKKGKILDFFISLYDSKIKLNRNLKRIKMNPGRFMINLTPICLHTNNQIHWPDFDAVYIASKEEIKQWATNAGYKSEFPMGTEFPFDEHTFIVIQKS